MKNKTSSRERSIPQSFKSTVYFDNGTRFNFVERLPLKVIEAEARKLGATKVVLR